MNKRQAVIVAVLAAAVAGAVFMTVDKPKENPASAMNRAVCQGEPKPVQGFCAPNFKLPTLSGEEVELYQNEGKPTVVNFWATWCPPCKEEMPYFQKLHETYGEKINVIMVNETAMERDESDVKPYLDNHRYTFPVALDRGRNGTVVGVDQYQLFNIPATFIINENGKITRHFMGGVSEKQLFSAVQELMQ
ncbi:TlpA family protein disulfide reductase [Thermoactinomyces intermedius]|jgi:thiol-disulfide isomerase/thioredoxin|uniref:TlpA family protein disulfide reductase n=1 Tax=Thermoactinomyces intermedius TaxID=2024 RepID=A0A8I1A7G5_THEIN|nr:TlpA disulfide reductase family protein [Thermoactinomyces intermedius]MBA4547586.1 TlpA family protein disulfide reductase [Thermoactinomyces intermedius]MBA4836226.1 TlpA family protein disulfide reductase [Thermoactinomyces intermedius]MBH8594185.1 TlpA family protein disulfide reductase [Thermoactinomyces intermedius]